MRIRAFIRLLPALIVSVALGAETPSAEQVLQKLRKGHPRILATAENFQVLRKSSTDNAEAARWAGAVRQEAVELLGEKPSEYVIPDGKRLLATSRQVFDRVTTLAMAYRLSEDARFRDRLWRELDAAAHFKNWNPSHFLDTAEMTAAFAIGRDWLHAEWSPTQHAALRTAIIEKGLKPSLDIYRKDRGWAAAQHNWNQVCNGGMTLGALAIADEDPTLAAEILAAAIRSVPRAMRHFAPDGAWGEGPGYWDYATKYNVLMLAALDTALGTDFGLSAIEGFSKAGDFPIHTTGPLGKSFNYADAGESGPGGSQLLWLATKFSTPAFAAWRIEHTMRRPGALDLLWGAAWIDRKPSIGSVPLARYFRDAEIVTMRSAWNDPDATFVGFKGGDNRVNHGHLDLGSFVFDAAGRRWAMDLGADNYNLSGYFGAGRWNFYRCRAEGQNTLVINPGQEPDQNPGAVSKIVQFKSGADGSVAVADLSSAYSAAVTGARRGIAMMGRQVLVQDEIQARQPAQLWWFMHTPAAVDCKGATATLTLDGRKLTARILSPEGASFTVMSAAPLPTSPRLERQQVKGPGSHGDSDGVRKIAIALKDVSNLTLTVMFSTEDGSPAPKLKPLAEW